MTRVLLLALSAFCGFISLSYEILWVRIFSFSTGGSAYAFPMALGLFLLGIAVGSRLSKRISVKYDAHDPGQLKALALFLFLSNLIGWLVVPLLKLYYGLPVALPPFMGLYLVAIGALFLGAQFPLLTHYGIEPDARTGANLSYFYMSNIVGSVAGSLLTGFVLLDHFKLPSILTALASLGTVLSLLLYLMGKPQARQKLGALAVVVVTIGALFALEGVVFSRLYEMVFYKSGHKEHPDFKYTVENKSGIINVTQDDIVYGSGVYDGHFSTDIHDDVNNIRRPMALSAFHPSPKKMLLIGLASGSWAKVAAAHPDVERIVVVEINPGYLELIAKYPSHAPLLTDPRIEIIIDDGRRWMHTTQERFDVVLLNTTFHWRSMSTGLLSEEFFELVKSRMKPGGIVMANSTGADRVFVTMFKVFPDMYRYLNNGIASNAKIDLNVDRLAEVWSRYKLDGKPVFDVNNPEHVKKRDELLAQLKPVAKDASEREAHDAELEGIESLRKRLGHLPSITDRNMGEEFSLERNLFKWDGGEE